MPELPEVEMVRSVLEPQLIGKTIAEATVLRAEVVEYPNAEAFCNGIRGETISQMTRRGKFLSIHTQSGKRIVLHFRMTGILLLTPPAFTPLPHTHLRMKLTDGSELQFSDQRRFGRFWLLEAGESDSFSGIASLGPEPFDAAITPEWLQQGFSGRKRTVKECLMDQTLIAGIGNIYSDELLHRAQIRPNRAAGTLTGEEIRRLCALIAPTMRFFVEKNAIDPSAYLAGNGKDYRNSPYLDVYGRGGKTCRRCGKTLIKQAVGGRGSVWCEGCQQ
ncbi:MAG: bifunctional DNA-formamidopyrimidine glycosylase/DNA-(apurinic or apyrimidinic site) lyase [Clostridia bacterium]|nr:bifunctional DNA-formamidopyrimidine glycosylase/DNA-(apurinic or apyrimidinic site) lyase [Clostridia bacterium]